MALADRRVQRGSTRVAHLVREGDQGVAGEDALDRQVLLAHRPGDGVLALLDGLVAALLGEPGADLVTGARGLHEAQPVARGARTGRLGGEDLHQVAVVQGGFAAVGTRRPSTVRHRPVADLRVDRVREVHRCRAGRKRYDVTLGREDEDLVAGQVEAQDSRSLGSSVSFCQSSNWRSHAMSLTGVLPRAALGRRGMSVRILEEPATGPPACTSSARRCRTRHGGACRRADWSSTGLPVGPDDRRVQRLVHVELGHRDVVLEPAGDRVPSRVHGAEGREQLRTVSTRTRMPTRLENTPAKPRPCMIIFW